MINIHYPLGHFFSPIVNPDDLKNREPSLWGVAPEMPGIDFNVDNQLSLLESLKPFIEKIDWPVERPADPSRFFL